MRKLLLMFVMLLGGVTTMQAQIFNFNCGYSNSLTSPGFTSDQIASLEAIGFTLTDFSVGTQYENFITFQMEGENGPLEEDDGTPITGQRRVTVVHFTPPREIVSEETGLTTYLHYQLSVHDRQPILYRFLQEAVDAALLLFPAPMVYQAGYPDADEDVLVANDFVFSGGVYTAVHSNGDTQYVSAPIDGVYYWEDPETTDEEEGTLAELLAYLGFN